MPMTDVVDGAELATVDEGLLRSGLGRRPSSIVRDIGTAVVGGDA